VFAIQTPLVLVNPLAHVYSHLVLVVQLVTRVRGVLAIRPDESPEQRLALLGVPPVQEKAAQLEPFQAEPLAQEAVAVVEFKTVELLRA
jgi:hypothetical protein